MRAFLLAATCLGVALARPEAGYTYNGQGPNGLLPSAHNLQPLVHQQLPEEQSFSNFNAAPQMTYLAPMPDGHLGPIVAAEPMQQQQQQHQHFHHHHHQLPQQQPLPLPQQQQQQQALPLPQQQAQFQQQPQQDSYSMAHLLSSVPHEATEGSAGYPYAPAPTKVHKHIYVHVPPKDFEEEDAVQPRVHHQAGPKQKHYKIVFIKAPSAPAIRAPIVPPQPQHEEKTLIYVLHKKPEAQQDIVIPTAAPTKPSKPEVYFIKYKTKKEEAPVYGPPPVPAAGPAEPRHAEPAGEYGAPTAEYGAPEAEYGAPTAATAPAAITAPSAGDEFPAGENGGDLGAPLTTLQTIVDEPREPQEIQAQQQPQQQPQFVSEMPAETYVAPTMAAFGAGEEPQPTLAAPSNQYLAPEPTATGPAPSEEPHVPASNYGPPARFFLKKRK